MAFCSKCGNSLDEGVVFCPKCGTPLEQKSAGNTNMQQPQPHNYGQSQEQYNQHQGYQQPFFLQQQPHINTSGTMVWAIINLFLCWPISIYSLITLNKVNKASTQEEAENYFKSAKTSCAIATGVGIIFCIIALLSQ